MFTKLTMIPSSFSGCMAVDLLDSNH